MSTHIVSFSGGKDSTAMLCMMLEKGMQVDRVIMVDTSKEFPEMHEHVKKVQAFTGIKIETAKMDFDYWLGEHVKTKGKAKGKVGYGWAGPLSRWCTALKREAYIRQVIDGERERDYSRTRICPNAQILGGTFEEYIGFSADELKRASKVYAGRKMHFPLIGWGITEQGALDYCKKLGFDWGGLYEQRKRVSCFCCPLQDLNSLRLLHDEYPELWAELEAMDRKSWRKFKSNATLDDIKRRFIYEKSLLQH